MHTVEKIGGTSMSDYHSVKKNIIFKPHNSSGYYQRVLVVSAYGGITNKLLEHKKTGKPGVYALIAKNISDKHWEDALEDLYHTLCDINKSLFYEEDQLLLANNFIEKRLVEVKGRLLNLQNLCAHGHFSLDFFLQTVREMLASIGEAHSAWNMTLQLKQDGINATFVDLTGWNTNTQLYLDDRIRQAFTSLDLAKELPVVTGYAYCMDGLMSQFDRGYSEMTFSRIAVLTRAKEAIIHKEYHLSSADPKLVGEEKVVPIGLTNYDVADQLANLGMEAIHPQAAGGLRQNNIPLRVKNTFDPDHPGTLISENYTSNVPRVEMVSGCYAAHSIEFFGKNSSAEPSPDNQLVASVLNDFGVSILCKNMVGKSVGFCISSSLSTIKRTLLALEKAFPELEVKSRKVSVVSVVGSNMRIPGILSRSVDALGCETIDKLSFSRYGHNVNIQFVVERSEYESSIRKLHFNLVENSLSSFGDFEKEVSCA